MAYEVNTEQFKGPLEKLLELIEEKKMEITVLNLSLVTDDFLTYLESIKKAVPLPAAGDEKSLEESARQISPERSEAELRLLADFIVVASRLILIKSKALLPSLELTPEDELDIKDLEQRLLFYKQFKPAMAIIKKLYAQKKHAVSRPLFANRPTVFSPAKNISIEGMRGSMEKVFETVKQLSLEVRTVETVIIKLEEKIEEIMFKVQEGMKNFGHLIKEKSRKEIVVMFLALLHLLREQTIQVEQTEGFSDIIINKNQP